jgi:hypothetical protein
VPVSVAKCRLDERTKRGVAGRRQAGERNLAGVSIGLHSLTNQNWRIGIRASAIEEATIRTDPMHSPTPLKNHDGIGRLTVTVPVWAWLAFGAIVVIMLAIDLFAHRKHASSASAKPPHGAASGLASL